MKTLNGWYQYGLNLFLLSIDEGITGYRDDSLEVSTNGPSFLSTAFYSTGIDHQAQSTTIRHASQDPLLRRGLQMDNGLHRLYYQKEGITPRFAVSFAGRPRTAAPPLSAWITS